MPTPVIIDCDPGHDDAMALLLAVASPELELVAVTTVAGNQTLDKVTANAIRVLDVVDAHAHPGRRGRGPRADPPRRASASEVHGETGLDGPDLPPPSRDPEPIHAVELMAREAARAPADADPDRPADQHRAAARHAPRAGVRESSGSWSWAARSASATSRPAAEFNLWADPEAAQRVFELRAWT